MTLGQHDVGTDVGDTQIPVGVAENVLVNDDYILQSQAQLITDDARLDVDVMIVLESRLGQPRVHGRQGQFLQRHSVKRIQLMTLYCKVHMMELEIVRESAPARTVMEDKVSRTFLCIVAIRWKRAVNPRDALQLAATETVEVLGVASY